MSEKFDWPILAFVYCSVMTAVIVNGVGIADRILLGLGTGAAGFVLILLCEIWELY